MNTLQAAENNLKQALKAASNKMGNLNHLEQPKINLK